MVRRASLALLLVAALSLPEGVAANGFCSSITSGSCYDFTGSSWDDLWSSSGLSWDDLDWIDDLIDDLLDELDDLDWVSSDWSWDELFGGRNDAPPSTSVPEPATWMLLGAGLVGVGAAGGKRRKDD